jgi:hypothetical protein
MDEGDSRRQAGVRTQKNGKGRKTGIMEWWNGGRVEWWNARDWILENR